jgi:hypothetical protein
LQEPLAGMLPPVKVMCELPAGAVIVPPQLVLAPPETTMPLGKTSVNGAVNIAAVLLGFVRVIVRFEVPPELMVTGLKALTTLGGRPAELLTVKVETVPTALAPVVVCSVPAPIVLRNCPSTLAVTSTLTRH